MIGWHEFRRTKHRTGRDAPRPVNFRWPRGLLLILCLGALVLSACLPEPATSVPPTATPTVTITSTPTATIIWFPPKPTYTPQPTLFLDPTLEPRPAVGDVLLRDDFSDQNGWTLAQTAAGSIASGSGELTLAIKDAKGSLLSLRETPQLANFYLEIDMQPSLCRGSDAFGLLLRAASGEDYYRVLANCTGQLRVELVKGSRGSVLHDWVASGQIPPGGLLRTRLGVWIAGGEMRIFVNDVYQFNVRDKSYTAGSLGVFARAAGDSPLTINFSNLVVYSVDSLRVRTIAPTPAPTLSPTSPRRPNATPNP